MRLILSGLKQRQSQSEEIANSISHGIGLIGALSGTPFLIIHAGRHGNAGFMVGTVVFAASIILLYLASTLYHAWPIGKAKGRLQIVQHVAILILIAGTYTPLTLVMTDFTRISGETRTNIILREQAKGRQYAISAAGPEIKATEIGMFYQHVNQVRDMDYLILSGSLPRAVSPNLYGQLILAGKKKGAFIVLDADGSALHEALDYQPTCIKPNIYELSRLAERELQTESEILGFCEQIHRKGITYIIVSRGKAGLLLSSVEQRIKAVAPPVEVDSTVGAGDSVVGGFVLAHSQGKDLADCVRLACATGTATAQTPGTELCHRADVEALLPRVELSFL